MPPCRRAGRSAGHGRAWRHGRGRVRHPSVLLDLSLRSAFPVPACYHGARGPGRAAQHDPARHASAAGHAEPTPACRQGHALPCGAHGPNRTRAARGAVEGFGWADGGPGEGRVRRDTAPPERGRHRAQAGCAGRRSRPGGRRRCGPARSASGWRPRPRPTGPHASPRHPRAGRGCSGRHDGPGRRHRPAREHPARRGGAGGRVARERPRPGAPRSADRPGRFLDDPGPGADPGHAVGPCGGWCRCRRTSRRSSRRADDPDPRARRGQRPERPARGDIACSSSGGAPAPGPSGEAHDDPPRPGGRGRGRAPGPARAAATRAAGGRVRAAGRAAVLGRRARPVGLPE